jgi:hypothetical protein
MRTRRCTPTLALEIAVRVRAFDGERGALDAGALTGLHVDELGLVVVPLAPAQVLAQQHLAPVLRLGAAGAGLELDDRVAGVVLAAEQTLQIHLVQHLFEAGERLLRLGERIGVAVGGHLEVELCLLETFSLFTPAGERRDQLCPLSRDGLRLLGIAPEVGFRRDGVELLNACLPFGEVKDTSRTPRGVHAGKRCDLSVRMSRWP